MTYKYLVRRIKNIIITITMADGRAVLLFAVIFALVKIHSAANVYNGVLNYVNQNANEDPNVEVALEEFKKLINNSYALNSEKINDLYVYLRDEEHRAVDEGFDSLRRESKTLKSELEELRVSAKKRKVDADSCFEGKEQILDELASSFNVKIEMCAVGKDEDIDQEIEKLEVRLENEKLWVQAYTQKLQECNSYEGDKRGACRSQLYADIQRQSITLPLEMEENLTGVENILHVSRDLETCANVVRSILVDQGIKILRDIIKCVKAKQLAF